MRVGWVRPDSWYVISCGILEGAEKGPLGKFLGPSDLGSTL